METYIAQIKLVDAKRLPYFLVCAVVCNNSVTARSILMGAYPDGQVMFIVKVMQIEGEITNVFTFYQT